MISFLFLTAALCVAVLILATKWGAVAYYQGNKPGWMPVCTFCFFFWLSCMILYPVSQLADFELWRLFTPYRFYFNILLNIISYICYALAAAVMALKLLPYYGND